MPTNTTEKKRKCLVPEIEIKLNDEDVKISLLELKRRAGAPKINFRKRK
jgi:hypothetical protein